MSKIGQLYASGKWRVKEGMEAEFIELWQNFAEWTAGSQPGAGEAVLLQNPEDPQSLLSFSPWDRVEDVDEWRSRPEFEAFVRGARELCEELEPRNMVLVGHVDAASGAADRGS
jgi:heme-degrading monooxygenase HmoA